MGFPVVNCSWTSFNYSCLNQTIIDYAISRNVVVVAAAGNHFASTPVYPASYQGVLGVGLCDTEDFVYSAASGYGTNAAVFAPGHMTWTTFVNDGEYAKVGYGSSYASPLAAGMMGLIRSRHPQLTPEQAIAFARICTDNIEDKNPAYRGKIGGRLNMLKAVTVDPLSLPGLKVAFGSVVSDSGFSRLFSSTGFNRGTAYFSLSNILGNGVNIDVRISTVEDSLHLVNVEDTAFTLDTFKHNSLFLKGIRFTSKPNATQCIIRFDFTSLLSNGDTLRDFALVNFTPLPEYYTHHTAEDSLVFSISDGGNIGYSDFPRNSQGEGFRYGGSCSYLYESGIMATNGKSSIVSQIRNATRVQDKHFVPITQFNFTDKLAGLLEDQAAPDSVKLNVKILERLVNSGSSTVARFDFKVARTVKILEPITVGHYFNWHFGGGEAKISGRLLAEALPDSLKSQAAAVMLQSTTTSDVIGCAVVSCSPGHTPMCRIFDNSITYNGFTNGEKMDVMNGPVRADAVTSGDIGLSIGMKIANPATGIEPTQPNDYTLLIAAAKNSVELTEKLRTAIANACGALGVDDNTTNTTLNELSIIPNPTNGILTLSAPATGMTEIRIMNLLGENVLPTEYRPSENGTVHKLIDISVLTTGTYIIQVRSGGRVFTRLCVKE
ncbi:MAG: S8 family serine peptidase [Ignavibacteria bacterium]|nr:S8 family serine peptidase [Ignavibacteria bacterium]